MGGFVALFWVLLFAIACVITKDLVVSFVFASAFTTVTYIVFHFGMLVISIGRTDAKKLHGTDSKPSDK